jgi:site-specific DNA-cytosine methylase
VKSLDLFSCIGCHAIGFERAGIETAAFCEVNPFRRAALAARFPGVKIYDDIRTIVTHYPVDIVIGGPPCQETSVAAAIHGYRTNESLWPYMLYAGLCSHAKWIVVEQPPGNAIWESQVTSGLSSAGRHVAKFEFGARDVGAPYLRRRVFLVACASLQRLEIARQSLPRAIDETKRAADARGDWDADQLATLPVDARAAGEFDRGSAARLSQHVAAIRCLRKHVQVRANDASPRLLHCRDAGKALDAKASGS